ncbi:MAG: hypothetical protein FWD11_03130 [Micrococcales bacterium]|nr:hypothetical protein [Micrococcales bacterium]
MAAFWAPAASASGGLVAARAWQGRTIAVVTDHEGDIMSQRGRKRRTRKGNAANHGKRPNA